MLEQVAEQYQNLSLQIKAILIALLSIGAGYLSYSDYVTTAQQSLQTALESEAKLTTDITNFNKSGQSLSSIESQKRKAEQELLELFALLPKDLEVDTLIANFSDAARESSVKMTSLKPEGAASGFTLTSPSTIKTAPDAATSTPSISTNDFASKTSFAVNIEGSFSQIVTFFDRILNLKRVIRLDSFELTPVTETTTVAIPGMADGSTTRTESTHNGSPLLSAKVKFSVFMQKGDLLNLQLATKSSAAIENTIAPGATPEGLSAKSLTQAPGAQ